MLADGKRRTGNGSVFRELSRQVNGRRPGHGFSLLELLLTLSVAGVLAIYAVPSVVHTVRSQRFKAAVMACTGAVQSTRYQAIMRGYAYAVTFDPAGLTYQVSSKPPGSGSFAATGAPVPIAAFGEVTLSQATTFQFNPNGTVQATAGTMSFQVSNRERTRTITVSGVGNVSVSP